AEDSIGYDNNSLPNWPRSEYLAGFNVNNSNTFIRYLVRHSGLKMKEYGWAPGRQEPVDDTALYNSYGNKKPWPDGVTPPPPATDPSGNPKVPLHPGITGN